MENKYYYDRMIELKEMKDFAADKRDSFFQYILFAASSIVGITASLHTGKSECLYIRLLFAGSIALFSLGILACGIVLYEVQRAADILQQKYHAEIEQALKEDRKVEAVFLKKSKRMIFCEAMTLICLTLGLILLALYACLSDFF
jgi:hypothetical protein